MIIAIIIGIVCAFFIVLWYSSISISVDFAHQYDDDHLVIILRLWRIFKYKVKVPMVAVDDQKGEIHYRSSNSSGKKEKKKITIETIKDKVNHIEHLLTHVYQLHTIVSKFFKKVKVVEWDWHTMVGVRDASKTALLTSVIWTVKSSIITLLSSTFSLECRPDYTVQPYYVHPISFTTFKCIVRFRIGNAIVVGLKVLKFWRNNKKGSGSTMRQSTNEQEDFA